MLIKWVPKLRLPSQVYVAVSGGVDSMVLLDFLRRSRQVTVLHYNHNTEYGNEAQQVVQEYCDTHGLGCITGKLSKINTGQQSDEMFWRECRYEFFDQFKDAPVCLGHTLDDNVEWYLMSMLRGKMRTIPVTRDNYVRPFSLTRKENLYKWATKNKVPFLEDVTNFGTDYDRTKVRNELLPVALTINQGLYTTVFKMIGIDT